ncbi:MAG: CoA transferase [Chloroflexi bacterium]|nr:CoA transferase [Chloroflexota bacterium]
MPGALDGVRVLDCSEIIAAPFAAMLLADMGAEVIKVEPPWGEPWRQQALLGPLEGRNYISLNRGKKSLPLDLTKAEAREIVYQLIPSIDVVTINLRPDVPAKLGIDYETLSAINPRLVYCENTAYGRRGPHSQRPGYDIIIQAFSGLMTANGKIQDGLPQTINPAVSDASTGLSMAFGVCAALYARERTGKGQKVEAALLTTSLAIQTMRFLQVERVDSEPREQFLEDIAVMREAGAPYTDIFARYETLRARPPGNIYYRTYQTRDSIVAVACLSDVLRKKMADALGLYDIRFEPGYDLNSEKARVFGAELMKKAEALFATKTTQEWLDILDPAGVPCGPIHFTEELVDNEQTRANDMVVELEHPVVGHIKMFGPVLRMSETPMKIRTASPTIGQHTDEILGSLGYTPADIKRLKEAGVTR